MGPGAIRHAENLFPTGLLVEVHDLLGDDAAVGIEVVLLVIAAHDRELGAVDHAELVGADTHGDRGDDVDLDLGRTALLVDPQGLLPGPRLTEDLLPKVRIGASEAVELEVRKGDSLGELLGCDSRQKVENRAINVASNRPD